MKFKKVKDFVTSKPKQVKKLVTEKLEKRRKERDFLDDLIAEKQDSLAQYKPDSKEYQVVSKEIMELIALKQSETEVKDKSKTNKWKIGVEIGGVVISAALWKKFWKEGLKFEEEGTYTSSTFRETRNKIFGKKL